MAKYPIKMLKDEEGTPFVPLVSADSVYIDADTTFQDSLDKKLEITNLKGSDSVSITKQGNDATFEVNFGAANNIIDNLNTTVAGQGSLDARQGNVLKNMIPAIADNLTTTDANKVLSANQGKVLGERTVKNGGTTGQVLKKASDNDYDLEWGDAADPNAIVGDGSIKKIIELTYEEYQALDVIDPDTEYHILDAQSSINNLEEFVANLILESDKKKHPIGSLEFNVSGNNPSSYLGFGTWELWGAGKVPVGVDISDTEFNTVEKTGGNKTHTHTTGNHTLTISEMPEHGHANLIVDSTQLHWAAQYSYGTDQLGLGISEVTGNNIHTGTRGDSEAHNHGDTGSSSTVQPYITCYMWKRTA